MNIKNFISVMASAVICVSCLSACTDKKNQNTEDTEVNAGETQEAPSEETSQPDEEFPESYPEYPVSYPEIRVRDVSETYEAEDTDFGDVLKLESPNKLANAVLKSSTKYPSGRVYLSVAVSRFS